MKKIIFSVLFFVTTAHLLVAQTDTSKVFEIFDLQRPPAFVGGDAELYKFLSKNLKYPAIARENNIQGSVIINFIIEKNGQISNPNILKDIGGGCGKEAIRVVNMMPKWTPGESNNVPVRSKYTLPFRFRLEDDNTSADVIYEQDEVDVQPVSKLGNSDKVKLWVEQQLRSKKKKASATVLILVDEKGNVSSCITKTESEKGLGAKCCDEITKLGKWDAGMKEGKPVSTEIEIIFAVTKKKKKS